MMENVESSVEQLTDKSSSEACMCWKLKLLGKRINGLHGLARKATIIKVFISPYICL